MQTKGLTVGQRIRMTRKYLGIKQYEITSGKITRNLISAIENDKVRLTADNARLIYDNLNRFAKERNMDIDLDLSDVLGGDPEYQAELQADQYIEDLKTHLRTGSEPPTQLMQEIEYFLYEWNIPVKKAELYELFGDFYQRKNEHVNQLFYQMKAFEYYSVEHYDNSLPGLSAKISSGAMAIHKPTIGLRFINLCQRRKPNSGRKDMYAFYKESAKIHSLLGDHDTAVKHIEKSIDRFTDDLGSDYYDAVSVKAACFLRKQEYIEAVQFFTHAANGFIRLKQYDKGIEQNIQVIRVLSDINFDANKQKIDALVQQVETHIQQVPEYDHELSCMLGGMYNIAGNQVAAEEWTKKALHSFRDKGDSNGYVTVVDHHFNILKGSDTLETVREEI